MVTRTSKREDVPSRYAAPCRSMSINVSMASSRPPATAGADPRGESLGDWRRRARHVNAIMCDATCCAPYYLSLWDVRLLWLPDHSTPEDFSLPLCVAGPIIWPNNFLRPLWRMSMMTMMDDGWRRTITTDNEDGRRCWQMMIDDGTVHADWSAVWESARTFPWYNIYAVLYIIWVLFSPDWINLKINNKNSAKMRLITWGLRLQKNKSVQALGVKTLIEFILRSKASTMKLFEYRY